MGVAEVCKASKPKSGETKPPKSGEIREKKSADAKGEGTGQLAKTLGNWMLKDLATPPEDDLRTKNWFPAKVSDMIKDLEWAVQFTISSGGEDGERACTAESCARMGAGTFEFPWQETVPKPTGGFQNAHMCSAPIFCHKLLKWSTEMRTAPNFWDELASYHYKKTDDRYKSHVEPTCKLLMWRMLCVYSHFLHHHWHHYSKSKVEEHFSHIFKHFVWFSCQCDLLGPRELEPLKPVIDCMFEKEVKAKRAPKGC